MTNEEAIIFIYLYLIIASVVALISLLIYIPPIIRAKKKYGKTEFLFLNKFKFTGGLELPQNVMCRIICLKSRIVMLANGQEFNLPTEKLIDVSVMTNTEIQKQYVSSAGGAVAGALLLGPVGAILGGSASKRSVRTNTKYLIFTYRDGEQSKYILFDVTKKVSAAKKFEKRFKYLKKTTTKIDL